MLIFSNDLMVPPMIRCDGKGCKKEVQLNKWARIRAGSSEGWMFKMDGEEAWCFDHLPDWVIPWRDWNNPGWREKLNPELQRRLPKCKVKTRTDGTLYRERGGDVS